MNMRQALGTVCQCAKLARKINCQRLEGERFYGHSASRVLNSLRQMGFFESMISRGTYHQNIRHNSYTTMEEMTPEEKACKFQRPIAQTTIDEEEVSKFSALSALWWDEGGEFEALHSLNELRVPLIRDALVSKKTLEEYNIARPLDGFWILDIGSGGGILSEPLSRLGASVIGVDASEENIKIAQAHLIHDHAIRERVKYVNTTVEEIAKTQAGKFDAVVASEVLEHVADANMLVSSACQLVKPGGSVFFTTINKTRIAYVAGVLLAENVLRLLAPGTHDWEKFVAPKDLSYMLDKNQCVTRLLHGMFYNPLTKRWSWTKDTSINYAIHAIKAESSDQQNVWTTTAEQRKQESKD
ncbi:ubiquinone biosynthesis O-methyltransferase, mitochondrial [Elysia marginata]|uniref:Ubiquinone biosynthesis O-methyltransferase, mitochondrial n=1 Tax=Elysia marginata TaxID=1093978 RepID=A0AAV4IX39_9GAST|nr:ubiquinone biosynthesis O-methyltransferase, mitochondrial [Elysia marginata]